MTDQNFDCDTFFKIIYLDTGLSTTNKQENIIVSHQGTCDWKSTEWFQSTKEDFFHGSKWAARLSSFAPITLK